MERSTWGRKGTAAFRLSLADTLVSFGHAATAGSFPSAESYSPRP